MTSDLDEHAIAALAAAPVDAYGVGTQLVTGSGHPTCGFVYKLVARADDSGEMVSVAKRSRDKISIGGRKYALRRRSPSGVAQAEVVGIGAPPADDGDDRCPARPAGQGRRGRRPVEPRRGPRPPPRLARRAAARRHDDVGRRAGDPDGHLQE